MSDFIAINKIQNLLDKEKVFILLLLDWEESDLNGT